MTLTNEAIHQKTSQELTSLLYEACYDNLERAMNEIDDKNYIDANVHLQKASDIVHRLGAGINYEAGILADQLEQVYNYMADRIYEANVKKDKAIIEEVLKLLTPIMTSWNEAQKTNRDAQPKNIKMKTNAYDNNSIYDN